MSKDGGEAGALGGWLNLFLLVFEFLVKADGCSSSSLNTRHLSTQAPLAACSHHLLQISISASFFFFFLFPLLPLLILAYLHHPSFPPTHTPTHIKMTQSFCLVDNLGKKKGKWPSFTPLPSLISFVVNHAVKG